MPNETETTTEAIARLEAALAAMGEVEEGDREEEHDVRLRTTQAHYERLLALRKGEER